MEDSMEKLTSMKIVRDDFGIEYEILSPIDISTIADTNRREIALAVQDVDAQINLCEDEVAKLSAEIEKLTNHADGVDYVVAVVSGILTGLIDSFFVGETEINVDKIQEELEKKYKTPNDRAFQHKDQNGKWISSSDYHRLEDLAHHPTLLGLIAAILVRFFRLGIFIKDGKLHIFPINSSEYTSDSEKKKEEVIKDIKDLALVWGSVVLTGIFMWLATIAEKKYEDKYQSEMPAPLRKLIKLIATSPILIQLLKSADTWLGHIMSDVSTSAGVPGIFLSILQEISCLPILKNTDLPQLVKDTYFIFEDTHISKYAGVVFSAVKKQSIPIIINECLVRGFYFAGHLVNELIASKSLDKVNWKNIIPFGNRTVERMMTIASGTFTAVDIADAAIRSGGFNPACLLRVNFVGVGRFALAIGVDVGMGMKRSHLVKERIKLMGQELTLLNAKVYYKCAQLHYAEMDALEAEEDMWIAAQDAEQTIQEVYLQAQESVNFIVESLAEIHKSMEKISTYRTAIEEKNHGLTKAIIDKLKY